MVESWKNCQIIEFVIVKDCGNSSVIKKERIVGGKPAIPGAWPWMVVDSLSLTLLISKM
jgi:hypothetical protein